MRTEITLTVTRGGLAGKRYVFTEPASCVVGRSSDCKIRLPQDAEHLDISRHHCELDIAPPSVRVRDLDSLNGTYVNGAKIGQRGWPGTPPPAVLFGAGGVELADGDEVRLGDHLTLRVGIGEPGSAARRVEPAYDRTEVLDGLSWHEREVTEGP